MPKPTQIPLFQTRQAADAAVLPRNLFFALRPDEAASQKIHDLAIQQRDARGLVGRVTEAGQLHVTLCFLGTLAKLPADAIPAADAAARSIRAAPFRLEFDRVKSFPGSNAFVLCREDDCPPLTRLRNTLVMAVARTGRFRLEAREFRPHVTLMHDPHLVGLQEVEPVGWTVRELLLIRSHHGLTPHQVVGRYPLADPMPDT